MELGRPEAMRALLDWDRVESAKPFEIVPMKLPALPAVFAGFKVRELVTSGELRREGRDMKHCVGGYRWAIQGNHARIVQIRRYTPGDKSEWSTVEFHDAKASRRGGSRATTKGAFGSRAKLVVSQHKGRFNEEPADSNKAVVLYLVASYGKSPLEIKLIQSGVAEALRRAAVSALSAAIAPMTALARYVKGGLKALNARRDAARVALKELKEYRAMMASGYEKMTQTAPVPHDDDDADLAL